jgi:hypothetical protein
MLSITDWNMAHGFHIMLSAIDGRIGLPENTAKVPAPVRASKISAFMLAWLKESLVTLSATTSIEKNIRRRPLAGCGNYA